MKTKLVKLLFGGIVLGLAPRLQAQPVITTEPTNQIALYGSNVVFSVMVTGVGPFTYQWRLNGTNLPNKNNIITRVAGRNDQNGFGGDGGPATNAVACSMFGVALDSAGKLLIVDQWNNRIRMVDTNGIINTVAGMGPNCSGGSYSGDGGMATNAGLNLANAPACVAVDTIGNLFIADTGNNRIRKVDTNGYISTIAGTNSSGFSGDGGLAVNAKLYGPAGVAVDNSGNLFIADSGNNRIRKIAFSGVITTVAGTNGSGFSGDGGMATNANLHNPYGIAVGGSGNLFIADTGNNRVRKVDGNGIISTLAGNGTASYSGDNGAATNATLNQPYAVAADAYDDVFISDHLNNRIRMVNAMGIISTVAGTGVLDYSGDGGAATNAKIYQPQGVGVDSNGDLYFTEYLYVTCRKVDFGHVPTLQLNRVVATNAGNYDVIVTSPYGSVTSSVVSLTVLLPPSITTQPSSVAVTNGGAASFNVAVSGTPPLNYQWFTSSGRNATAVPVMGGGSVFGAIITSGGFGYLSVPQVQFVGGSGSGASGTAVVGSGRVTAINMTSYGYAYYAVPPTIQISGPDAINASALADQTNATLARSPVMDADATNYFVLVTNNYGSVTSSTVTLAIFLPPQNFSCQNVVTGLQMNLTGSPSYPYILQSATNLTPPVNWKSIRTNSADTSGNWQFTDTNLNGAQKFYRALGQ